MFLYHPIHLKILFRVIKKSMLTKINCKSNGPMVVSVSKLVKNNNKKTVNRVLNTAHPHTVGYNS